MSDETTPQRPGTSRRDFLRRGAIVGGTLVWAAPTVQAFAPRALAHYPNPVCHAEFRYTGNCATVSGPHAQSTDDTCQIDSASAPTVCSSTEVDVTACNAMGSNVTSVTVSILPGQLLGHGITDADGVEDNGDCVFVLIAADNRSATFIRSAPGRAIRRVRILVSGP